MTEEERTDGEATAGDGAEERSGEARHAEAAVAVSGAISSGRSIVFAQQTACLPSVDCVPFIAIESLAAPDLRSACPVATRRCDADADGHWTTAAAAAAWITSVRVAIDALVGVHYSHQLLPPHRCLSV